MKKIVALLLFLLPTPLFAQSGGSVTGANFTYRYNLNATTLTFCRVVGANGNPRGGSIFGQARIKTTASSVNVVAVTAGQAPFRDLAVNDIITVTRPGAAAADWRVIVTKTDNDTIVVDTAVDWSAGTTGFEFRWLQTQCGTTDNDGWIETAGMSSKNVTFALEQISGVVGGIDWDIECRTTGVQAAAGVGGTPTPTVIHPGASGVCSPGTSAGGFCNFTVVGKVSGRVQIAVPQAVSCAAMRFGMKINTSDAAEPTEPDKERITVTLDVEKVTP